MCYYIRIESKDKNGNLAGVLEYPRKLTLLPIRYYMPLPARRFISEQLWEGNSIVISQFESDR